jgi:EAL domain-containing protein (putative c-di-GMP-specific phosphodiesterase class I)
MYRYFVQPQFNQGTQSLFGYELLIREYQGDHWGLPVNFSDIDADIQTDLLLGIADQLKLKIPTVAFNVNRTQFLDADMTAQLIAIQVAISPLHLMIEVTEEAQDCTATPEQLRRQIALYHHNGIQISLDDIESGGNVLAEIRHLLAEVDEIKFAMQNFRRAHREAEIPSQLAYWQRVANFYHVQLVVEGIENAADEVLLDRLGLQLRQGYYYGKPHLFPEAR